MSTGLMDLGVAPGKSYLFDKAPDHTPSTFANHQYRPQKRLISKQEKKSLGGFSQPEDRALIMGISPEIDEIMDAGYPSYMVYIVENDPKIQEKLSRPLYSKFPKYFGDVEHGIAKADGRFSYVHLDYMCMFKPEVCVAIKNLMPKLSSTSRVRFTFDTSNRGRTGKAGRHSKYREYCNVWFTELILEGHVHPLDMELRKRFFDCSTEPIFCAFIKVLEEARKHKLRIVPNPTVINYRDTTRMQTGWVNLSRIPYNIPLDVPKVLENLIAAVENPVPAPVV